ncbi:MAG: cytochrome c oxidase assembly protein [Allorhizobium sp.]
MTQETSGRTRGNAAIFVACLAFVAGMVGMSFAAVPLYQMFCQVTGYNGTTQRVEQVSDVILDRTMNVTFDANVDPHLMWKFEPVDRAVKLRIGETVEVHYTATNHSSQPATGQAVFNVTPMEAAAYFNKIECFCFTDVQLKPGETRDMPVVFFIDPEIVNTVETKDIGTITLSYTFYPHEGEKPVAALPGVGADGNPKL